MPHDKDGNILHVGDTVMIEARIREIHGPDELNHLTCESIILPYPDAIKGTYLEMKGRQVMLLHLREGLDEHSA